eukprot:19615-Pelagococcus_subviridis.AAC.1
MTTAGPFPSFGGSACAFNSSNGHPNGPLPRCPAQGLRRQMSCAGPAQGQRRSCATTRWLIDEPL